MENVDWHTVLITDQTVINKTYKSTQNVRRYFKSRLGEAFKFDRSFMQWMKQASGLTMAEACHEWRRRQASK